MKNRFNLNNTLIYLSNEEIVDFLDYDELRNYVCSNYNCCKDCYFAIQYGQCIFSPISIDDGKKLIVEWLEKKENTIAKNWEDKRK